MSEKKREKRLEELCRSRLPRAPTNGEKWPQLSEKSCQNFVQVRSPSPRGMFATVRGPETPNRHQLFPGTPRTNDVLMGAKHSAHEVTAMPKRKSYQGAHDVMKKTFFPGISSQVITHADPPFPSTDTQPLPPINLPKAHEAVSNTAKQVGKDNRPFTIHGQMAFESTTNSIDIGLSVGEERAGKRKLEALKRVEEQERLPLSHLSRRQPRDSESKSSKKKRAGAKRGKNEFRRFTKPLAWKSPWPDGENADMSGVETDWTDIN